MFWEHIKPLMRTLQKPPHMSSKTVFTLFLDVVLICKLLQNYTLTITCQEYKETQNGQLKELANSRRDL